jgi:hypothetical protein
MSPRTPASLRPRPDPAQVAAWDRLWRLLLADPEKEKPPLHPTAEKSEGVDGDGPPSR